jgi:hypothetical protein
MPAFRRTRHHPAQAVARAATTAFAAVAVVSAAALGGQEPPCALQGEDAPATGATELVAPLGTLLSGSKLRLRWRSDENVPFRVTVLEDGRTLFTASTYGRELRVIGTDMENLHPGGSYRWTLKSEFAKPQEPALCADFTILPEDAAAQVRERFETAAAELGVGDEAREPEGEIELARLYLAEGLHAEAEEILETLRQRGWDDPRIAELLAQSYRATGRAASLREVVGE